MELCSNDSDFTQVLNQWAIDHSNENAQKLKSAVYYHLREVVQVTIEKKAARDLSTQAIEQLPNTTSLLHEVLIKLAPPDQIFNSRLEYIRSLASFVRWMLLDELKAKNAQKRNAIDGNLQSLLNWQVEADPYYSFDIALTKLENLSKRCADIALMHYFLGYSVSEIADNVGLKKSSVHNELATAKAFIRSQYVMN